MRRHELEKVNCYMIYIRPSVKYRQESLEGISENVDVSRDSLSTWYRNKLVKRCITVNTTQVIKLCLLQRHL